MHDPNTVAFEIRSPIPQKPLMKGGRPYHASVITIWHRDPERRGDDDSCGWCFVRLSDADRAWVKELSVEHSYTFDKAYPKHNLLDADDVAIMHYAWLAARQRVTGKHRSELASAWDLAHIHRLLSCPSDNFAWLIDNARERQADLEDLFRLTLRMYRTAVRPVVAASEVAPAPLADSGPAVAGIPSVGVQPVRRMRSKVPLGIQPVYPFVARGRPLAPRREGRLPSRVHRLMSAQINVGQHNRQVAIVFRGPDDVTRGVHLDNPTAVAVGMLLIHEAMKLGYEPAAGGETRKKSKRWRRRRSPRPQ
jgi:hypothetical protein